MNQPHADTSAIDGVEIHGMTRESFLLRGAIAAGAVYGLSAVGPFTRRAFAQEQMDDIGILNYALTLEFLEAEFYKQGLATAKLSGEAKSVAQEIGQNEQEHVTALMSTIKDLGGTPVQAPKVKFPFTDQKSFLKLAQTVEDLGVSAYNGAAPMIKSKEILAAAGSIAQIEARHAARVALLNNNPPATTAFEPAKDMDAVLEAVQPFLVS